MSTLLHELRRLITLAPIDIRLTWHDWRADRHEALAARHNAQILAMRPVLESWVSRDSAHPERKDRP